MSFHSDSIHRLYTRTLAHCQPPCTSLRSRLHSPCARMKYIHAHPHSRTHTHTQLRTQATFRVLIKMLSDLNREYSREGQEVECDICNSIPIEPVRFCGLPQCRRLVCKACADGYLKVHAYCMVRGRLPASIRLWICVVCMASAIVRAICVFAGYWY